jgi:hypothetical protein
MPGTARQARMLALPKKHVMLSAVEASHLLMLLEKHGHVEAVETSR